MIRRVGAITIGQSPRPDLTPELAAILGPEVEIVERGALDDLTLDEVRAQALQADGPVLVSRMRDGTEVILREGFVLPRVQSCLDRLQSEAELVLLLCTGTFPALRSRLPVLYPEHILYSVVRGVLSAGRLGVLTPAEEQREFQLRRWREIVPEVVVATASPYSGSALEELRAASETLRRADVDLVVMDCIGYSLAMKRLVAATTGRSTIVARSALAHVAALLLE